MEGYNTHRHKGDLKEKGLHDKFVKEYVMNFTGTDDSNAAIDCIIFGSNGSGTPNNYLGYKDKKIVISTIQWLGSPVGKKFLEGCGFKLEETKS